MTAQLVTLLLLHVPTCGSHNNLPLQPLHPNTHLRLTQPCYFDRHGGKNSCWKCTAELQLSCKVTRVLADTIKIQSIKSPGMIAAVVCNSSALLMACLNVHCWLMSLHFSWGWTHTEECVLLWHANIIANRIILLACINDSLEGLKGEVTAWIKRLTSLVVVLHWSRTLTQIST